MSMEVLVDLNISYMGQDGSVFKKLAQRIHLPYRTGFDSSILIPAGTVSGTEFDIPFGSISTYCAMVLIHNKTGQELNMAFGGNWAPHLSADGWIMYANPNTVAVNPIKAGAMYVRFFLTQDQLADGAIDYMVYGN